MTRKGQPQNPQNLCMVAVHGHVEARCGEIIHVQTKVSVLADLKPFRKGIARHRILTHISEALGHAIERSHLNVFDDQAVFRCNSSKIKRLIYRFSRGDIFDFLVEAKGNGTLSSSLEDIFRVLDHIRIHGQVEEGCHPCRTHVVVLHAQRRGRLVQLHNLS